MTIYEMQEEHERLKKVHDDLGDDPFLVIERLRLLQKIECLTVAIEAALTP
jgi:hypothetical protein